MACIYLFVFSPLPFRILFPRQSVTDMEGCEGVGDIKFSLTSSQGLYNAKGYEWRGEGISIIHAGSSQGLPCLVAGFPSIASVTSAVAHAAPDVSQMRDTPLSLSCPQGASRSDRQISPLCPGPSHLRTGRARLYDLTPCPRCRIRR